MRESGAAPVPPAGLRVRLPAEHQASWQASHQSYRSTTISAIGAPMHKRTLETGARPGFTKPAFL